MVKMEESSLLVDLMHGSLRACANRGSNKIESATDLLIFVIQSRHHIGTDKWK